MRQKPSFQPNNKRGRCRKPCGLSLIPAVSEWLIDMTAHNKALYEYGLSLFYFIFEFLILLPVRKQTLEMKHMSMLSYKNWPYDAI